MTKPTLNSIKSKLPTSTRATKKQWLFLIGLVLAVTTIVIAPGLIISYTRNAPLIETRNSIIANGTETDALSTGQSVRSRYDGDGFRKRHSGYYAEYLYKTHDGTLHKVIGTRKYLVEKDIQRGVKATVKFLYVDGELKATVIKEDIHDYNRQTIRNS